MLDFAMIFVNFEKNTTMVITTTMFCTLIQMILNVKNFFVKWQRDIGIRHKSNSILKHIEMAIGSTCKGRLFIGMWKCFLGFHTNPLEKDFQFHGQLSFEAIEDCLFN